MKKEVFTCSNRSCPCLDEKLGLYFFTTDIKKAEKHSRENNSPMFISNMDEDEVKGMYTSIKITENLT